MIYISSTCQFFRTRVPNNGRDLRKTRARILKIQNVENVNLQSKANLPKKVSTCIKLRKNYLLKISTSMTTLKTFSAAVTPSRGVHSLTPGHLTVVGDSLLTGQVHQCLHASAGDQNLGNTLNVTILDLCLGTYLCADTLGAAVLPGQCSDLVLCLPHIVTQVSSHENTLAANLSRLSHALTLVQSNLSWLAKDIPKTGVNYDINYVIIINDATYNLVMPPLIELMTSIVTFLLLVCKMTGNFYNDLQLLLSSLIIETTWTLPPAVKFLDIKCLTLPMLALAKNEATK